MEINNYRMNEARMLQNKLSIDEELPIAYAAILAEEALHRFDPRVREGVKLWMEGKLTDDFGVEDATIAEIREEFGLEGFQALCFMDIYLKNPDFCQYDVTWFERRYL